MYKLVIVEDEENIRNGFLTMIDWHSMGYEVVADFGNGMEALRYMEYNPVDVIFTDIKLGKFTGIDLARELRKRESKVQIVFISGHKDFEFAKDAVNYNVAHYLLKPVRLDELFKVFSDLRGILDKEKQEKADYFNLKRIADSTLVFFEEQFLYDLLSGAITTEEALARRLEVLGPGYLGESYVLFVLKLLDYSQWKYGIDNLWSAIINLIPNTEGFWTAQRHIQYKKDEMVVLFCFDKEHEHLRPEALSGFLNNMKEHVLQVLNVNLRAAGSKPYSGGLSVWDAYHESLKVVSGEQKQKLEHMDREILQDSDLLKGILGYILQGDAESLESLLQRTLNRIFIHHQSDNEVKNELIKFISYFNNKITEVSDVRASIVEFDYSAFLRLSQLVNVRPLVINHFRGIAEFFGKNKQKNEKTLVANICEYLKANYCEEISLNTFSDQFYFSPSYLSRLFKEQTGEYFNDYLTDIRIGKAKEMLADRNAKVYEVCEKVGYKSQKYFSRLFRNTTGFTPTEYQKMRYWKNDI